MPARYRLVTPGERIRTVLKALVGIPFLTVVFAVPPFVVLRPYVGDDVAGVVAVVGGLVALVGTGSAFVREWRELPPVEIGPDGVLVRVRQYEVRRLLVPWPEIEAVAVSPGRPAEDTTPDAGAVRDWLAFEHAVGRPHTEQYRWGDGPGRVRIVVGLRPGSRAQAAEFAIRIDGLRRLVARHDRAHRADGARFLVRSLEHWQEQWAQVPQAVGLHTEVRTRAGDHERLTAAVARFRPGLPVRPLPPLTYAELDTPHDVAAMVYRSVSAVLEPPAAD